MLEKIKIVYEGGQGEVVQKKSRFLSFVFPIHSEEEAIEYIESTKKKHWDANHNCYAYVLGENHEIIRCSDDGEPAKTAGKPILDVLLLEDIHNTLVIVTRYFGGTLLGTGGLVRAYQGAAKEGLLNSTLIEKQYAQKVQVLTDYNGIGKLQYIIATLFIDTLDTIYTDIVEIILLLPNSIIDNFTKEAMEATGGKAVLNILESIYYGKLNGELLLFPNTIKETNTSPE